MTSINAISAQIVPWIRPQANTHDMVQATVSSEPSLDRRNATLAYQRMKRVVEPAAEIEGARTLQDQRTPRAAVIAQIVAQAYGLHQSAEPLPRPDAYAKTGRAAATVSVAV